MALPALPFSAEPAKVFRRNLYDSDDSDADASGEPGGAGASGHGAGPMSSIRFGHVSVRAPDLRDSESSSSEEESESSSSEESSSEESMATTVVSKTGKDIFAQTARTLKTQRSGGDLTARSGMSALSGKTAASAKSLARSVKTTKRIAKVTGKLGTMLLPSAPWHPAHTAVLALPASASPAACTLTAPAMKATADKVVINFFIIVNILKNCQKQWLITWNQT